MEDQIELDSELKRLISLRDVDLQKSVVSKMTMQQRLEAFAKLKRVLHRTDDFAIKDSIALFFYEFGGEDVINDLIEEIDKKENDNHYGTLIFACSAFDCSDYLSFFAKRVVDKNYEVSMAALGVIEGMKKGFDEKELRSVLDLLREKTEDQSVERKENIEDAIAYLEDSFK